MGEKNECLLIGRMVGDGGTVLFLVISYLKYATDNVLVTAGGSSFQTRRATTSAAWSPITMHVSGKLSEAERNWNDRERSR